MRFTDLMLIFSLLIVGIYGAASDLKAATDLPPAKLTTDLPVADPSKHKTTTTTTTATTTIEPTTSTPAPKTSTTQSTSSSSTPPTTTTTTTSAPTTTKAPTTTAPVTTTTTVKPSPTPAPKPPSEPEASNWTLTEGNRTCILVELATQLNVSYITNDNKTKYLVYNIPKDPESHVNGSCGNINGTSEQFIVIQWSDNNAFNLLNMTFKLNHTTNDFSLNKITFELDKAIFPNDANFSSYSYYHVGSSFATPKQNSYHCTRPQILNLTNSETTSNITGTVSLSHTLLEAYHEGKNKQFSTSIDCDAISTPDIVPIAVGIALIALVIIVLIAYVIGRRRSQAHGYVSM